MLKRGKRKNNKIEKFVTGRSDTTGTEIERTVHIRSLQISSPIPPPEIMRQYNALMPEATERFFSLAEKQSSHRQYLEKKEVEGQNRRANLGLIAAWSSTIILCISGAFLLYHDKQIGAYTTLALGTLPRFASFIFARYDRKKQMKEERPHLKNEKQKDEMADH